MMLRDGDQEQSETTLAKELRLNPGGTVPDDEDIAGFLGGTLPEPRRREVEAWLAADDDLRAEVLEEARIRKDAVAQPLRLPDGLRHALLSAHANSALPGLVQLVFAAARQCLEVLTPTGQLVALNPVPVRGGGGTPAYRLVMGGIDVEVAIERQSADVYELGLRVAPKVVEGRPCEWQLWSGQKLVELQPTEHGEALFCDLPAGKYRCVLLGQGRDLGGLELTLESGGTADGD